MAHGQWRSASVLLALTFVLMVGAVPRMEAQPKGSHFIVPLCNPLSPDRAVDSLTPAELTNSLPCAEVFGAFPSARHVGQPPQDNPEGLRFSVVDELSWTQRAGGRPRHHRARERSDL